MKNQNTKSFLAGFLFVSSLTGAIANALTSSETSSTTKNLERPWNLNKTTDVGIGAKWGLITGFNLKYWISEHQAWDFTVAFADNNTLIGVDYLLHYRDQIANIVEGKLAKNIAPYVGIGLLSSFGNNKSNNQIFDHGNSRVNSALRVPFGIEYLPTNIRLGFFAELGFGLQIAPKTFTFATGNLGARFYF